MTGRMLRRWAAMGAAAALALVAAAGTAQAGATVNATDREYLVAAHQSNLAEIAAGKLAESKAASQDVKDLGAMLIADHTKLDAAVRKVAATVKVSLPQAPNAEQRAMAAKLSKASADEFDAIFVAGQIAGHAKVMAIGAKEQRSGSSAVVKKAAAAAAPVVMKHHDEFTAQAQEMGLPAGVNSGMAAAVAQSNGLSAGLVATGGLLVLTGLVIAVRQRRIGGLR